MKRPIILVDMDDTVADYSSSFGGRSFVQEDTAPMFGPGFFLNLKPVPGALVAIRHLINLGYDLWICTQPLAESPHSYEEKVKWIGMWFPELIKKIIMTQDKGMIRGDYLIDDNAEKWKEKFEAGGGKFVHFEYVRPWESSDPEHNSARWSMVVQFFRYELKRSPK